MDRAIDTGYKQCKKIPRIVGRVRKIQVNNKR